MIKAINNLAALFIALVTLAVLSTLPAFAQDDSIIRLDTLLAPWLEIIVGVAVSVFVALGSLLTLWIKQKTGLQIDFFHRDTLQTALNNAAGWAKMQAKGVSLDVRSPVIRDAILMVNEGARDAVRHFGATDDEIARRILAKIGIQESVTTVEVVQANDHTSGT